MHLPSLLSISVSKLNLTRPAEASPPWLLRWLRFGKSSELFCKNPFDFTSSIARFSSEMAAFIRKNPIFFIFKHASNNENSLLLSPNFFSTQTLSINPTVYDILVHKHNFPREFASWVTSQSNRINNPEKVDSILSFLKSSGFSIAQLQKILKYKPTFLLCKLEENFKPKIKNFEDEGFSSAEIAKIISICPNILQMSLKNYIMPSFSVLKDLLGSDAAFLRVVSRSPRILNSNLKKTVVPNVEFLKSCGISMDRIRIILESYPRAFYYHPTVIRESVEKAEEMGVSKASNAFVYAVQTIAATSNGGWEPRLQAFRDMGFSESDIVSMFKRDPRVFTISIEKMKKITELLLATGKFDISGIVDSPGALRYSTETRYKPRLRILRVLESKNLIQNWPTLPILYHSSDAQFFESFVTPYLDHLSDVLHIKS